MLMSVALSVIWFVLYAVSSLRKEEVTSVWKQVLREIFECRGNELMGQFYMIVT